MVSEVEFCRQILFKFYVLWEKKFKHFLVSVSNGFEMSDTRNRARLILEYHIHIHYIVPDNFVGQ